MNPVTSNTLLTYSLDTVPDPLQASPTEKNTLYGALSFVVSNGGNTLVHLSQLQFTLPVGPLAQDLTSDAGAILWATSPGTLWNVTMTSPGVFLLVPHSGNPIPVSTDGMVIQFFNIPVNQKVGTVSIKVNETAASDTNPLQVRTATFNVAKFPYGFYFGSFTAKVPMVDKGGTVTLTWQGSDNATYSIQWSTAPAVDVTNVRSWLSPALTSDTTFLLRAQVVSQGETVIRDLATTVIVANPELRASSLQVTGISNLQGATTIGNGSGSHTTVNGKLTVTTGPTTLTGTTTLSHVIATDMAVTGTLTFGKTTAFNNVVVNGSFAAIKSPQEVGQGTYTARTDGILVASIKTKDSYPAGTGRGTILVKMPWYEYKLSGGDYMVKMYDNSVSGGSVMSIPVQQGQSCSITIIQGQWPLVPAEVKVFFIPLGNIPKSQEAFVKTSDEVPTYELPEQPAPRADHVESIANALLEAIDSRDKGKLTEALKGLLSYT
jgi:hypothetical protein